MNTNQTAAFNGGKENCTQNKAGGGRPGHSTPLYSNTEAAAEAEQRLHRNQNCSQDAGSQRTRILAEFMAGRSVNTFRAREELDVMHPAARIRELTFEGHMIETILGTVRDKHGRAHGRVATYVWHGLGARGDQ